LSTNLIVPGAAGTRSAKVQSRLLSSKVLATEVAAAVEDLKVFLQPKLKDIVQEGEVDGKENAVDEPLERPKKVKKVTKKAHSPGDSNGNVVGLGEDVGAGWESGSIVGDEEKDEEDSWESGSVQSGPIGADHLPSSRDSDSEEEEGADEVFDNPPPKSTHKESDLSKTKSKASKAESTFLPSLSVGFIRGDSDCRVIF